MRVWEILYVCGTDMYVSIHIHACLGDSLCMWYGYMCGVNVYIVICMGCMDVCGV